MENRERQYQSRRGVPQRAGVRKKGRGRASLYLMIVCGLLAANLIFSMYLQIQIRDTRDMLDQLRQAEFLGRNPAMSGVSVTGSSKDQQTVSGSIQNTSSPAGSPEAGNAGNEHASSMSGILGKAAGKSEGDYVNLCGLEYVQRPVKRTEGEVLRRLKELSGDSETIKYIYDNAEAYSGRMLEALANNPEMAEFVAGYPEAEKKAQGGFTDSEKEQEYPLFLQWDPRWGYVEYGDDGSIGLAGCGPTCLSMVLWYLLRDESLTPDFIAQYSMENGYYVWGVGTAWALLEEFPTIYGVDVRMPGIYEEQMKNALDQGSILICSMSQGEFTTGGHFIVIYGYDEEGFWVNDSNCVARSRRSWSFEEIGDQIKQVWSYGRPYSGKRIYDAVL